jgi:hypothetical protein
MSSSPHYSTPKTVAERHALRSFRKREESIRKLELLKSVAAFPSSEISSRVSSLQAENSSLLSELSVETARRHQIVEQDFRLRGEVRTLNTSNVALRVNERRLLRDVEHLGLENYQLKRDQKELIYHISCRNKIILSFLGLSVGFLLFWLFSGFFSDELLVF